MHARWTGAIFFLGLLFIATSVQAATMPTCPANQVCFFYGASLEKTASQKSFSTTGFSCPVAAAITVPFSHARNANGKIRAHLGIGLDTPVGTAVKAAANGKVIQTPTDYSDLGTVIILRHSDNPKVETQYGHLQKANVRPGDTVKKGDIIGLSGQSGQGTDRPMLYFELDRDGNPSSEVQDICKNAYVAPAPISKPGQTPKPAIPNSGNSVVGGPSLGTTQILSILKAVRSPAADADTATCFYEKSQQYNIDVAYMLAFFGQESTWGTASGYASTHTVGNIVKNAPGSYLCDQASNGRFCSYSSWCRGAEHWYYYIKNSPLYLPQGKTTPEQIIPIYAPASENNVGSYVAFVNRCVTNWRAGSSIC
ncbi:M23 family metallopeptidase [Candidatus Micrarchaeota archaeon]|nr:M23 family metallopeptidase [Candidatus Micrarchaeota archaeon]